VIVVAEGAPVCTACENYTPSLFIAAGPESGEHVALALCPSCLHKLKHKIELFQRRWRGVSFKLYWGECVCGYKTGQTELRREVKEKCPKCKTKLEIQERTVPQHSFGGFYRRNSSLMTGLGKRNH
jgi:hypothetical protein